MAANQSALKALENGADSLVFKGSDVPSEREMDALFKDIHLDWFPSHYDLGESNTALLYLLLDYFETNNYDLAAMKGSIYIDPLSDLYLQGNFDYTEQETFRLLKTLLETGIRQLPGFRLVHINTLNLRDAGASAAQELGIGLAQAAEYLHRLTDMGLDAADILPRMQFYSGTGGDYFMEIAKYRALRQLLDMLSQAYGHPQISIPVLAATAHRNKTVFDPHNNMLRATAETMAAAIGGADQVTVMPFDEIYRQPDEFSYRMTRNLQLILKEEAAIGLVVDASAGSYYIETLTQKLADQSWELFLEIEKQGGYISALKNKFIQQQIEFVSNKEKQEVTEGKKVLIGTNKYVNKNERKSGEYTRVHENPVFRPEMLVVPIRPERLAEKLETERLKLESQKAEKEN
jgi:methylmalonyl-CoA mutase